MKENARPTSDSDCILELRSIRVEPDPARNQWNACTSQEKLRDAAKARIRRMVKPKKHRRDLEAPSFVKVQWEQGSGAKNQLADLLLEVNGDKDLRAKTEIS